MNLFIRIAIILLTIISACGQSEKPGSTSLQFPANHGAINDFGNIYSDKEEQILDSLIRRFEAKTSIEVKVVSLDSSMTTVEGFNSYILRLANTWNVGKKQGKDNGVLIGISRDFQRVRITNGLGVEKVLTDLHTRKILDDTMFPLFRQGNYFEGTRLGLMELIKIMEP